MLPREILTYVSGFSKSRRSLIVAVTKSELIERIADSQSQLSPKDVELAVKLMVEEMSHSLSNGGRIEIRGFGSFSLHYRASRMGRNPKTGSSVDLNGKYVPHFKPGKELRDRVNNGSNLKHASEVRETADSVSPLQSNKSFDF